jgi:hypothetical protein
MGPDEVLKIKVPARHRFILINFVFDDKHLNDTLNAIDKRGKEKTRLDIYPLL